ncbi:alpha-L-fucosidase [Flavobacterium sp.]|uniref:alpha-L-fucosidase n=1 Tax=Flavobacterium sp. TaxID=239 RepID=UPI003C407F32
MKSTILGLASLALVSCSVQHQTTKNKVADKKIEYKADWESLSQHQTPEWFLDAKFGIYFHWGVYSKIGRGEWYPRQMYEEKNEGWGKDEREYHLKTYGEDVNYHDFIKDFTAEHFDANEWSKLFKASGAKYVGPVAEHCDNFSNWDSKINKFNAAKMGPKRNIVGELEKAIKGEGLKFVTTFHHSWEWGWYNTWSGLIDTTAVGFEDFYGERTLPETFGKMSTGFDASGQSAGSIDTKYAPSRKFIDIWKAKIYEVVDQYQPDLLWFDSRLFVIPEKDRLEMVAHYYNKSLEWNKPVVLTYKNEDLPLNTAVIDLERGRFDEKTEFPWLTDDSYAWNSWSWRPNMRLKNPHIILDELVDIVSKNGNLILNITPTYDGLIPEEMKNGLIEIGNWLSKYGEAIYKTRPFVTYGEGVTVLKKNHFGGVQGDGVKYTAQDFRFTTNGNTLYIIQLVPPVSGNEFLLKSFAKGGLAEKIIIN